MELYAQLGQTLTTFISQTIKEHGSIVHVCVCVCRYASPPYVQCVHAYAYVLCICVMVTSIDPMYISQ